MNPLGVPETMPEWVDALRELAHHAAQAMPADTTLHALRRDMELAAATRWRWAAHAVHPSHRVPGDVLGLRCRAAHRQGAEREKGSR